MHKVKHDPVLRDLVHWGIHYAYHGESQGALKFSYYNGYGKEIKNVWDDLSQIDSSYDKSSIVKYLDTLRERTEAKEEQLVKEIIGKSGRLGSKQIDYSKMGEKERISFWTQIVRGVDLTNGGNDGSGLLNPKEEKDAFALLLNSEEIYSYFKDQTINSMLSSTIYSESQNLASKEEGRNKLLSSITKKGKLNKKSVLYKSIVKEMTEVALRDEELRKSLAAKVVKEGFESYIEKEIRNKVGDITIQYNSSTQGTYDTYKKSLKDKLVKVRDSLGLKEVIDIKLNDSDNNQRTFLRIGLQIQGNYSKEINSVDGFIKVLNIYLQELQNKVGNNGFFNLNLTGVGIKSIDRKVLEKSQHYIQSQNFKGLLNKNQQLILEKKGNAQISGMLGELAALLNFSKFSLSDSIKSTGMTQDQKILKGKALNLGESFSDIQVSMGQIKYGVNVKHYVYKKSKLELYKDDKFKSVFSNAMYRYFTEKEVKLMRWLSRNYKVIDAAFGPFEGKGKAEQKISELADQRISSFLRISSEAVKDNQNLLFYLNGIVIPTSSIYQKIIELINSDLLLSKTSASGKNNNNAYISKSGLFEITVDSANTVPDYWTLQEKTFLMENLSNRIKAARIRFKGLTVDLSDLF